MDVFSGAFVVLMAGLAGAMTVAFLEFIWVFKGIFGQRNVSTKYCKGVYGQRNVSTKYCKGVHEQFITRSGCGRQTFFLMQH